MTFIEIGAIEDILHKHAGNHSILKVQQNAAVSETDFSFHKVDRNVVLRMLQRLNPKKATGHDKISSKFLRMGADEISFFLTSLINDSINSSVFPSDFKLAEVSAVFKSKDSLQKKNFRPISILNIMSKVEEWVLADQLYSYFNHLFSVSLSGYRKKYGCNTLLLGMIEKWKKAMDNKEYTGAILIDLSKAFDLIPHGLLLAKMKSYGMSISAVTLIASYLQGRKQRVKINDKCSDWLDTTIGVPQGSVLGPLLFNIFLQDIFYFLEKCDLENYADDNTLNYSHRNIDVLTATLCHEAETLMKWFKDNGMVANIYKFQAMFLCPKMNEHIFQNITINDMSIVSIPQVKLLGVTIDDKMNFNDHINNICCKATRQLNALCRLNKVLSTHTKLILYKSFIMSNFSYAPLVWHFCGRGNILKMEKINERALRFVFNDFNATYDDLLKKANTRSLQASRNCTMATEIFKCFNDLSPAYIKDLF